MIGVLASSSQRAVVREFFELFKTPWEWFQPDHDYRAVLSTTNEVPQSARVALVYGAGAGDWDREYGVRLGPLVGPCSLSLGGDRLPLYGAVASIDSEGELLGQEAATGKPLVRLHRSAEQIRVRLGFDIFEETERLLTGGQPVPNAEIPTLDHHIALLRDLLLNLGVQIGEIPPVPAGYAFISCLTHDVDHPALRFHGLDHTVFGFLRRALLDSPIQACRGRIPFGRALRNAGAAAKLPLVFAGLAADPWSALERYLDIEGDAKSTFFLLPTKGDPGRALEGSGRAPAKRASPYGAVELQPRIERLLAGGCEVGLHGLDAWADADRARAERNLVPAPIHAGEIGIRMHWLYFNEESPARLEEAGFSYDSTVGYNATIGYKAGTSQVYRPLNVSHLLELPLHIMDTALFYPSYLNLTDAEAQARVEPLLSRAARHGGAVTINWHDRSIAPERLWGDFYRWLLSRIGELRAWRPTAAEAVSWFRWRRSATFQSSSRDRIGGTNAIVASPTSSAPLPPLLVRTHAARNGLLQQPPSLLRTGSFHDQTIEPCQSAPATLGAQAHP